MTPDLHTLTGNLLCERTLDIRNWAVGATQRAQHEEFNTRGKGVNVSNMLARLGTNSTALIFSGGAPGAEAEAWLQSRGVSYHAFRTRTASRTGTVIWSDSQPETTFLGPDVQPDRDALRACADWLEQRPDDGVLALCGSFPGWGGADYAPVRAAIFRWAQRGRLLVDAYGPPLCELAAQPVEVVKINRQEFNGLLPPLEGRENLEQSLRRAHEQSAVKNWVITDGPNAVWVMAENAQPVCLTPPTIKEVSPTGSGDVLFAVMLHQLFVHGRPLLEAVRRALPYAAANAAHKGVADFELPVEGS
ncbi:MAG: hypothetical protein IT582_08785 [Opitutaceae bacterium]|nr:hypothetical protein [Opitutaceae bacterium]